MFSSPQEQAWSGFTMKLLNKCDICVWQLTSTLWNASAPSSWLRSFLTCYRDGITRTSSLPFLLFQANLNTNIVTWWLSVSSFSLSRCSLLSYYQDVYLNLSFSTLRAEIDPRELMSFVKRYISIIYSCNLKNNFIEYFLFQIRCKELKT